MLKCPDQQVLFVYCRALGLVVLPLCGAALPLGGCSALRVVSDLSLLEHFETQIVKNTLVGGIDARICGA